MARNKLHILVPGSPAYVVEHAKWRASRNKRPSMAYLSERNPTRALAMAKRDMTVTKMDSVSQKLKSIHHYLKESQAEQFYDYCAYLADHLNPQLVPEGFYLSCELALYDLSVGQDGRTGKPIECNSMVGLPPMFYNLMRLSIPTIARAVLPPEIAEKVIEHMEFVNKAVKKSTEKERAQAVKKRVLPDNDALFKVFTAAKKIADLSYEPDFCPETIDRRSEKVNPFYNQTTGGLFLEMYYGGAGSIWTPWGKWGCWGGGLHNEDGTKAFLARLGLEIYQEKKYTTGPMGGEVGPVYKIVSFDGILLPEAEVRPRIEYLEYEEANEQWATMEERYEKNLVTA